MSVVSPPYANRGVSRYDASRACWRCCHCDGLVYLSPSDAGFLKPLLSARERAEAGEAHTIGFRQYLHYGCGVWLGPGRQLLDEDLERLRYAQAPLSGEQAQAILAHYAQDEDTLRQRLWHYAVPDALIEAVISADPDEMLLRTLMPKLGATDTQILVHRNLFTPADLEQVRLRVHVSEADWRLFEARNRDLMPLPSAGDPDVYWELDYARMWGQTPVPQCARCDERVEERAPGLCWDSAAGRRYMHHVCYRVIADTHRERAMAELRAALPSELSARLDEVPQLALQQLLQMRGDGTQALGHRLTLILDAK